MDDLWRGDMNKPRLSGGKAYPQPAASLNFPSHDTGSDPEFLMNNPREIGDEYPPGMHFEHRAPQPYIPKNNLGFHPNPYSNNNDFETKAPNYGFPNYPKPQQNTFDNSARPNNAVTEALRHKLLVKYGGGGPEPSAQANLSYDNNLGNMSRMNMSFDASTHSTNYSQSGGNSFGGFSNENSKFNQSSFLSQDHDSSFLKGDQSSMLAAPKALAMEPIREESSDNQAETTMKAISKNQLNCISLLNEISSKVKKRVDYIVKDLPLSKVKVFECACVFDKITIGVGKGNSKQAAKNEAAVDGVRTLLTKEEFALEKAHVTLSVQKMTGIGPEEPAIGSAPIQSTQPVFPAVFPSNSNRISLASSGSTDNVNESDALMNDSALYELNLIAKECFIEPRWKMSPAGGPNGEFEAEVIFDKLVAVGKGRKKVDAKRDAAMQIITKIRNSKELSEKYNPKTKRLSDANSAPDVRTDRAKNFFDNCLDSKFAVDTQTNSLRWRESLIELERNFDDYLSDITLQYRLDEDMIDMLQGFFKVISDHTNIITSNPKQVLLDAPKHLADYVTNCCLVPTGSFALDCMRRDNLSVNAMLVFEETKRISEREFLSLYQYSLKEYQDLLKAESQLSFEIDVQVESSELGDHLVIKAKSVVGHLTMLIQIFNSSQNQAIGKYDPSIVHIKRIYDCFEDSYQLQQYREMIGLMRLWRTKNNLFLLPPELLDVVLLNSFLNNKAGSTAGYIINCLVIMSNDETFQASLTKCGSFYTRLYKDIPSKLKWSIASKCSQSLEAIYKQSFKTSSFC